MSETELRLELVVDECVKKLDNIIAAIKKINNMFREALEQDQPQRKN